MYGLTFQSFGGKQLEPPVGTLDVHGAHFCNHIRRDVDYDFIKAHLGIDRFRHNLAEPTQ